MFGRVGRVFKLLKNDGSGNVVAQFFGSTDSAWHAILAAGEAHFGAVGLYQIPTLHAHGLRHCKNKVVSFHG